MRIDKPSKALVELKTKTGPFSSRRSISNRDSRGKQGLLRGRNTVEGQTCEVCYSTSDPKVKSVTRVSADVTGPSKTCRMDTKASQLLFIGRFIHVHLDHLPVQSCGFILLEISMSTSKGVTFIYEAKRTQ